MSGKQIRYLVFASLLLLSFVVQLSPADADSPREILRLGRGAANALDWRPDRQIGAKAVLGGVQLYDTDYHETTLLNVPELITGQLSSLNWSPDGHFLAVGAAVTAPNQEPAYMIYIWAISTDGNTVYQQFTITDEGFGSHVSWKPDSTQVAVDGRVYDTQTGKLAWTHRYGWIEFDVQTGQSVYSERNREGKTGIYWSPDGQRFASIEYALAQSSNTTYAIFADSTDELILSLTDSDSDPLLPDFSWSPDGSKIVDHLGRMWDTQTGVLVGVGLWNDEDFNSPMISINRTQTMWSPDSQSFALLSSGKLPGIPASTLYKVDAISGALVYKQLFWHDVRLVGWIGNQIEASSNNGHQIFLDAVTGKIVSAEYTGNFFEITGLAWSPDSKKLVAIAPGPVNYPLQVWDIEISLTTGEPTPLWTVNNDWFDYEAESDKYFPDYAKVRWSADGQEIITVSNDISVLRMFHSVERWDAENGESLGRLYFSEARMLSPTAEPSPDLQLLAQISFSTEQGQPYTVEILRSDTLQPQLSVESANADIIAWNPDNQRLAAIGYSKGKTEIWDVSQNPAQLLKTLDANNEVVKWSPDGSLIAVGVQIFNPATYTQISQLEFDASRFYRIEWSPSNRVIAVYGYPRQQISFYSVSTGNLIQSEPVENINTLAWSPDGTMLAVGIDDGTIRIWDVSDLE